MLTQGRCMGPQIHEQPKGLEQQVIEGIKKSGEDVTSEGNRVKLSGTASFRPTRGYQNL